MDTRSISGKIFDYLNYAFLIILCVTMLYPFWNTFIISLMPSIEASSMEFKLFPKQITLEAYRRAFTSRLIGIAYVNTITRTVIRAAAGVFLTFCAAYPLSKKKLPMRNYITLFLVIPMFFSGGLIPNFLLIRSLGLFNTYLALIIPGLIGTYNILIMRNFIMSIPDSLEESAVIDGASFFRVMISIIIPLSTPILATIALWISVATWNDWFGPMIYTQGRRLMVLQLYLRRLIIEMNDDSMDNVSGTIGVVPKSVHAATILISIGPIILTYPFFQKYFVKGIMVGSLKG